MINMQYDALFERDGIIVYIIIWHVLETLVCFENILVHQHTPSFSKRASDDINIHQAYLLSSLV